MKIVLDTNVLVSGLLNPHGPPGQIVRMVAVGDIVLFYDARITTEYRNVLLYPKFNFDVNRVDSLIDVITDAGIPIAAKSVFPPLPDPEDTKFLEVAIAGTAEYLVTGNLKHYPKSRRCRVNVISPAGLIPEIGSIIRT
jgi:putative PIN family toxin of toxin-antitoxin system